jgi:putative membrane protein insertion efficiency factor
VTGDSVTGASPTGASPKGAALRAAANMASPNIALTNGAAASGAAVWLMLVCIRFYQAGFAPLMPLGCKFYPSCSRYAAEAIARHGARKGARLALARLWRCRPFTPGGVDLVPDVVSDRAGLFGNGTGNGARSEVRS